MLHTKLFTSKPSHSVSLFLNFWGRTTTSQPAGTKHGSWVCFYKLHCFVREMAAFELVNTRSFTRGRFYTKETKKARVGDANSLISLTQWTWVWVNSRSWWWTGSPGVLQSMKLQRVGYDWVAELTDEGVGILPIWQLPSSHGDGR